MVHFSWTSDGGDEVAFSSTVRGDEAASSLVDYFDSVGPLINEMLEGPATIERLEVQAPQNAVDRLQDELLQLIIEDDQANKKAQAVLELMEKKPHARKHAENAKKQLLQAARGLPATTDVGLPGREGDSFSKEAPVFPDVLSTAPPAPDLQAWGRAEASAFQKAATPATPTDKSLRAVEHQAWEKAEHLAAKALLEARDIKSAPKSDIALDAADATSAILKAAVASSAAKERELTAHDLERAKNRWCEGEGTLLNELRKKYTETL